MQKSKMFWLFGITTLILANIVLALLVMLKHEPNYYRHNQIPAGKERKELADKFLTDFSQMMLNIKARLEDWGCDTTEAQLNCFFEETFVRQGEAENLHKLGISSPRIAFEGDQARMAFRYGKGWFSTVISYDLKLWLLPKEPNVVAVQILSARAGALPISRQSILYQLSEFARKQNYEVSLYRHENTPVAIVRLQPEQPNPISTLTMLKFENNTLMIRGKTVP